jgi:rhodanese-related sulfurtransferase
MYKWQEMTPDVFLESLENGDIESNQIIDVREQFEWDFYHMDDSVLIPMNTIPTRLGEIDDSMPLYIVCAHGVRSAAVCQYLEEQGYTSLHNITGGMAAIASLKGFQYD